MAKEFIETTVESVKETLSEPVPVTGLIMVKQLPIIEERLESMRDAITDMVNEVLALPVTEDTVKEIKKKRSELNKQFKELDNQRKEVKKKVIEPYDRFEKIFKTCVTEIFTDADKKLSERISEVESTRKAEKEKNVKAYFVEYSASLHIPEFVTYERLNLDIILSVSEKKYKEQVKAFLDRVSSDLQLIETQPDSDEVLVEYKKTLDSSRAIVEVNNRHKLIEAERQRSEQAKIRREEEAKSVAKVEAALQEESEAQSHIEAPTATPVELPNDTQLYEGEFKLIGIKQDIKDIIDYINQKGVKLEINGKFKKHS